jgi:hypothetical protein
VVEQQVRTFEFDVCLSYASEQRVYVDDVAADLERRGIDAYYDQMRAADTWGRRLTEHLDFIYRQASRYCVIFVSADYARKVWPTVELSSAVARMLEDPDGAYILPARFDDTELPGLPQSMGFIDLRQHSSVAVGGWIAQRIGAPIRPLPEPEPQPRSEPEPIRAVDVRLVPDRSKLVNHLFGSANPRNPLIEAVRDSANAAGQAFHAAADDLLSTRLLLGGAWREREVGRRLAGETGDGRWVTVGENVRSLRREIDRVLPDLRFGLAGAVVRGRPPLITIPTEESVAEYRTAADEVRRQIRLLHPAR